MASLDFDRLFSALPQPHAVLDRDLRFVAVNPALEAALNLPAGDVVGRQQFEIFPGDGDNTERVRFALDHVLHTAEPSSIAFLRYDIPLPNGGEIQRRYWSLNYCPVLDADGETEFIIAAVSDVTELAETEGPEDEGPQVSLPSKNALIENARRVEKAFVQSAEQAHEFRQLFRQAPGMIAVLDGPDHVFSFVNDSFSRFVSDRPLIGRPFFEALPELVEPGFPELLDTVFEGGRAVSGEGARMEIAPGGKDAHSSEIFFDFACNPLMSDDDTITGVFFQGADRTEAVRANRRHRILVDELNHRVKNTLSTVQAMARQSFRNVDDPEEARYAFEARIMALSQAHNVLSARRWESAALAVLLAKELSSFPSERVSLKGPHVLLDSKPAIALAMVFHELASNAVRYGALSRDDGALAVEWKLEKRQGSRVLHLYWTESAPSVPRAEIKPGFGIKVLKRIVEGELAGSLSLDLKEQGLICRLEVLLSGMGDIENSVA